ncbi:site-specific integrase [Caballeronia sordidicola]|uniref:Integrase n=1 Tax=Caballeronia sordidicola TaxID=196367 RepID=A0A242MDV3_CABSO|nr:site-specific integrase [Caballeronia sordidicola]OTP69392.1 Integrase [Caballeronia sordidicola]
MSDPVINHLVRRGGRYSIRRKIPADLKAVYGRAEIVKALGTSDPDEAAKRCRVESVRLDQEFDDKRKALAPALFVDPISGKTWDPNYRSPPETDAQRRAREEYEQDAEEFQEEQWRTSPPDDVQHDEQVAWAERQERKRQRRLSEMREAYRQLLDEGTAPGLAAPPAQSRVSSLPDKTTGRPLHLSGLVEKWAGERKPEKRTVGKANLIVGRFWEHIGRVPVADITRRHIIDFKDKLLESGQTAVNTDKQLTLLSTLLNYAADNLLADSNVAKGIKVGERKNAKASRLPFDKEALNAIFSSPVYTEGFRPEGGAGEAAYWLPLLALFTGARIEELSQLRPTDIAEQSYLDDNDKDATCWVLRITNAGEGQQVKNKGSVRTFPIHAELINRGLLAYAESQRGKERLFDKLKPDGDGSEGALFGKWFGKYLRGACKVTDTRMVFHSFRHCFKDFARQSGINEDVSDALSGHTNGKVSRTYGGINYPIVQLVAAVARYRVAGVKLPSTGM